MSRDTVDFRSLLIYHRYGEDDAYWQLIHHDSTSLWVASNAMQQ